MRKNMIWIVAAIAAVGAAAWGPIVSNNVEKAKYDVAEVKGDFEIRDYAPMIVAEVTVSGERDVAINQGFRLIADYIFGNNAPAQKLAMTSPVIQQSSEKIAMTSPVIQQGSGSEWKVRFVMPANYTMETLPKPNNKAVTLHEIAGKRFAVIEFSGIASKESLSSHTEKLNEFISSEKLKPIATPSFAFYNPPWTLPFLRRNEVMIETEK
jgi:hypothetical protein